MVLEERRPVGGAPEERKGCGIKKGNQNNVGQEFLAKPLGQSVF